MRFFDTNILIYAATDQDKRKSSIARDLLAHAMESNGDGAISTQVVSEFCNAMRRKVRADKKTIDGYLDYFCDLWRCDVTFDLARHALSIQDQYGVSYYDAAIIAAAERIGCHEILTEDLSDGQEYCGMLAINPFKSRCPPRPWGRVSSPRHCR